MRYKIGDKVRVRNDLNEGKRYYMDDSRHSDSVNSEMIKLAGTVVTIKTVTFIDRYSIVEDERCWSWTDGMFEGLAYEECLDFLPSDKGIDFLFTIDV